MNNMLKTSVVTALLLTSCLTAQQAAPQVIGNWVFKPGQVVEDTSGQRHVPRIRGTAVTVADERFGGALASTGGGPENDKPQGAFLPNAPYLNPTGAFSIDLWVNPAEGIRNGSKTYFLFDKKVYHYDRAEEKANLGYCAFLTPAGATDTYVLNAHLGFRTHTIKLVSKPFILPLGEWHHFAVSYDGEGTLRTYLDDQCLATKRFPDCAAIAPSTYVLSLGDRSSSTYHSFVGKIANIRFCQGLPAEYAGAPQASFGLGRTAFFRFEQDASCTLTVNNDCQEALTDCRLSVTVNGTTRELPLENFAPHEIRTLTVPVPTDLKTGSYQLDAVINASRNGAAVAIKDSNHFDLVNREIPYMPVVMWGSGSIEKLKEIGFTHDLYYNLVNLGAVWKEGKPVDLGTISDISTPCNRLNTYMKAGLHACLTTAPGRWVASQPNPEYKRIDRQGRPAGTTNVAVAHPDIQKFGYNAGASSALTFGKFPSYTCALIHSEIRDNTALSFQPFEVAAAEKALGCKIPENALAKNGVPYRSIPDFPVDRVVPDDDLLLRFYTWFWKDGDGWNPLHTQIHNGLKSTGRKDFWTFFDPAVRVPSIWGSGGHVDVISQWTYSYPDPLKIGQATDELFAMAEGTPGQQVMKMTQIIWYRRGTAPEPQMPQDPAKRVQWERDIPDAKFISIAPDHLSIALWSMLARPVRGIMYHGWGSLVTSPHGSYRMTNPETAKRLTRLTADVVRPLGPTLLQIPDAPTDIAILESFASQMYTQCGSSGWSNGWEADCHLALQWAGYQPRIIYDETIRRDGLDNYRVLVMPNCAVLTRSVADAILRFQARGGIVVGDNVLCPAILPDLVIAAYKRTGKAHLDKEAIQKLAAALRSDLDPFLATPFRTSTPDLAARLRRRGSADYLFLINDHRTYGDYVGQYGLVMEKGLPLEGTVSLRHPNAYVYDLMRHQPVKTQNTADGVSFPMALGPGEGTLCLASDTALEAVTVTPAAKQTNRGKTLALDIRVTDRNGKLPDAVVPVDVRIRNANGEPAEFSGYYAAVNGKLAVTLAPAVNDTPGEWTVTVTDLASGQTANTSFTVR